MRKALLLAVAALLCLPVVGRALPPLSKTPSPEQITAPALLNVTAPASGKSWALKQMQTITWTSANISGYVRIDLYRNGTAPQNKVGTITANAALANGKYAWEAGKYLGGTAAAGGGYLIVLKTDTPAVIKASGTFSLVAPLPTPPAPVPPPGKKLGKRSDAQGQMSVLPSAIKILTLTYPRRADLLHKGVPYPIKWNSNNLKDAKLRLQLLNSTGDTVLNTIENLANDGELLWGSPMSLPDEETLYKIRLQTMDGAFSDTAGPIRIAKVTPYAGTKFLEVKTPLGGDRYFLETISVKWQTPNICSAAASPIEESFTIDLMDEAGTTKVAALTDSVAGFDGAEPGGLFNWKWDWWIKESLPTGYYRVRVTNWNSTCTGMGTPFRLMPAQERRSYNKPAEKYQNCWFTLLSVDMDPAHEASDLVQTLPLWPGKVGFSSYQHKEFGKASWVILRSLATFSDDPYWYKPLGHLQEAKLVIERTAKITDRAAEYLIHPCLGGVALPTDPPVCSNVFVYGQFSPPPPLDGKIPVNTDSGNRWEVDVSQHYVALTNQGKPDHGIMLYSQEPVPTPCPDDDRACIQENAESFKLTLKVRFVREK